MIHCTISIGYASFPMAGTATDISLDSGDQPGRQGALRGQTAGPDAPVSSRS